MANNVFSTFALYFYGYYYAGDDARGRIDTPSE